MTSSPSPRKGAATRARLTESMLQLIHTRGYHGAGMSTLIETSGAPKGSLYFHFPGGKSELGGAAIELAAEQFGEMLMRAVATSASLEELVDTFVAELCAELVRSDYRTACPVAAVTLDAGAEDDVLRAACSAAYASWVTNLESILAPRCADPAEAHRLASASVSLVEGALIVCRAQHTTQPLEHAATTLKFILAPLTATEVTR